MPSTPTYALPYPAETDTADVPRDIQALAARLDSVLPGVGTPTGGGLDWYAATPPAGFLLCDGSAISRSSHAALFAVLGTTWGAGDGSSTFNLPDTRGRVVVGYCPGGHADVANIGLNDGTAAGLRRPRHVHTVALNATANHNLTLPDHAHAVNDPGHDHAAGNYTDNAGAGPGGGDFISITRTSTDPTGLTVGNPTSHPAIPGGVTVALAGSVGATGSQDAPSYVVAAKAIKT
jgi:microcystin-dependent protein